MKTFNAFQMVCFFAIAPFGLAWVRSQDFPGDSIAFWVGAVIYLVSFILMTIAVRCGIDDWNF